MARPLKDGLDYFPLNVTLDTKFELIEAEYGVTGFAVIVKLYQYIYSIGYYCEWNKEVTLLFARKNGLGGNVVSEIVKSAINRGIFSSEKFNNYGILTSSGIQKRYFDAIKRRKNFEVKAEYLLVPYDLFGENVNINSINVNNNFENESTNTQSKVKESKVKESKVKKSRAAAAVICSIPTKNGKFYQITTEQFKQLQAEYPNINVKLSLLNMVSYYTEHEDRRLINYDKRINVWLLQDSEQKKNAIKNVSYDIEAYENTSIFD